MLVQLPEAMRDLATITAGGEPLEVIEGMVECTVEQFAELQYLGLEVLARSAAEAEGMDGSEPFEEPSEPQPVSTTDPNPKPPEGAVRMTLEHPSGATSAMFVNPAQVEDFQLQGWRVGGDEVPSAAATDDAPPDAAAPASPDLADAAADGSAPPEASQGASGGASEGHAEE